MQKNRLEALAWLSDALYVSVAVMSLIPDRRIERAVAERADG